MTEPDINTDSRSFSKMVLSDAFSRTGAKIGLAWIVVLVLFAVLAPLLANSYPLLLSENGKWSSPFFNYLTAADISIFIIFLFVIALFFIKMPFYKKFYSVIASVFVVMTVAYSVVDTPQVQVYEKFREAEQQGKYDWVIYAPIAYSPKDYIRDAGNTGLEAPFASEERTHVFGTEESGSDVLSRMIHASRIALAIGFVATGIALLIGVIIGGLMGYFSGVVDMLGMRLVEMFEAIPVLYLLLTFVAFFGPNIYMMMVIIGITSWPGYARFIRAEFLKLRSMDFVQSAKACGLPLKSILFRHMLPNGLAPVLVAASFGVASAILAEATLSFLGLGLVDEASWGSILNQAVQAADFYWWLAFFPGGAIFFTVLAYNLIGESLRDAIDPYVNKSR